MNDRPILFLDIDGVIATDAEFNLPRTSFVRKNGDELRIPYSFNPECVKILNEIILETKPIIVVSSDWRKHYSLFQLSDIFKHNGVILSPQYTTKLTCKYFGNSEGNRGFQIEEFIKEYDVKNYVILDDMFIYSYVDINHFVRTNDFEGLTEKGIKEQVIKILKNEQQTNPVS